MGTNHEDGMIEIIYRDGRVERLGSAYGLVSDGVEIATWASTWGRSVADSCQKSRRSALSGTKCEFCGQGEAEACGSCLEAARSQAPDANCVLLVKAAEDLVARVDVCCPDDPLCEAGKEIRVLRERVLRPLRAECGVLGRIRCSSLARVVPRRGILR